MQQQQQQQQQPAAAAAYRAMYVEEWAMFLEQAEALYRSAPLRTRYVLKYRHCDGKLILKVTDDVVVRHHLMQAICEPQMRSHSPLMMHTSVSQEASAV